jgi:flagellar basal-body rod protein FlgB
MDVGKLTLFQVMKKRVAWLTQRQEVLAHNVANADTPGYRARDLMPVKFQELVRRENAQLNVEMTATGHLGGRRKRIRDFLEETDRRPFETSPSGNAVVLEEQMGKLNDTQVGHRLTTELYKKHLGLIKMALGRPAS